MWMELRSIEVRSKVVSIANAFDANGTSSVSAGFKVTRTFEAFVKAAWTKMGPAVAAMIRVDVCHCILARAIDRHFAKQRGADVHAWAIAR